MPIYEYRCEDCGKITEIFFKSANDNQTITCSYCGSDRLTKIVSAPGAVIMGGSRTKGRTCCGRTEPCDTPPCSEGGVCQRD
ncbi:hypothetical protein BXT86_05650 [candidate division WOR-3 bacterium 4484_100]|uniref:Putative regulatory protein FmdB zinc ribbon domain-containing protein n=1 Tax=candidate division WOR-3 bacterium 4484_100 TaxID=1936077 RepID=A0A1V4QEE4_UNCW3|nr:MAG: hypothetical protein BXT86_05650 [candidate division WOR-3 bacterium 4484_100]